MDSACPLRLRSTDRIRNARIGTPSSVATHRQYNTAEQRHFIATVEGVPVDDYACVGVPDLPSMLRSAAVRSLVVLRNRRRAPQVDAVDGASAVTTTTTVTNPLTTCL